MRIPPPDGFNSNLAYCADQRGSKPQKNLLDRGAVLRLDVALPWFAGRTTRGLYNVVNAWVAC